MLQSSGHLATERPFFYIFFLIFSCLSFLFSFKESLGFFITLESLNDFPLYLFDIRVYFFSVLERSTPVSGSSSIPAGVMFLGRGVNVLSGFSTTCLIAILYMPNKLIIM